MSRADLFIVRVGLRALHCEDLEAIQQVDKLLIIKFFIQSTSTPSSVYLHRPAGQEAECNIL